MNIKTKMETLQKIKFDLVVEYEDAKKEKNYSFIELYLKPQMNEISREINQLEDLWLDGVENVE